MTFSSAAPGTAPAQGRIPRPTFWLLLPVILWFAGFGAPAAHGQSQVGSLRGVVTDQDFDVPLAGAEVTVVESNLRTLSNESGGFLFQQVPVGRYTVIVAKPGYVRRVLADVVVRGGVLSEIEVPLAGEFSDLEEYIVQDPLALGGSTEAGLLALRFESPSLVDSVGAELMSRAGASDAAAGLRLVAGASVQDGKYAVVRGLPDRFVSSQLNGVRLPTADEDKRAVELDQFPSPIIESIQVSKTFTPDQQGDASGGAVDVRLRGIPSETILQLRIQGGLNSQTHGRDDFLTYEGGGVDYWGDKGGDAEIQFETPSDDWTGAVGVSRDEAPTDFKYSLTAGGKRELGRGLRIGGLANFFYERSSSFIQGATDDSWWAQPGQTLQPQTPQGSVFNGSFITSLFDVTESSQSVQWGGLGTVGIEGDRFGLDLSYVHTRSADDRAVLAEDTRGKQFFFPDYDPDDPTHPGNQDPDETIFGKESAPYLRTETLTYTERTTDTYILGGDVELPLGGGQLGEAFVFQDPVLDVTGALSSARLYQPDKRQFGSVWKAASELIPGFVLPAQFEPFKPGENINFGNLQRIWKDIEEDSEQLSLNLTAPFEQWDGESGYFKVGLFDDAVERSFDLDSFTNGGDTSTFEADFDVFWSEFFPLEDGHTLFDPLTDVDYRAEQDIEATYAMVDLPLSEPLSVVGGVRWESTDIQVRNTAELNATWFPPGALGPSTLVGEASDDADVDFQRSDSLPALGLVYEPSELLTFRAAYSQTVARQTFKELTPIIQQEFLGAPVFIGNPFLGMSQLDNYDLRADFTPFEGSLLSVSWFYKTIEDPIEYVQRLVGFSYTTPINYPEGQLSGYELEVRQHLGRFASSLHGLNVGANATFIDSEVTLPEEELADLVQIGVVDPSDTRVMTNAPEYLLNLFVTYDIEQTGTQLGLFFTEQGETLLAGSGVSGVFLIPDVYAAPVETVNLTLSQALGRYFKLQLQLKNLTDPEIETFYRSDYVQGEASQTTFRRGVEFTIGLSASFSF